MIARALLSLVIAAGALTAQTPADSAAIALLERTTESYRSARTLRAEFTQTMTNPRTGNVMRSAGEFLQRGTQQFAFIFTDPPEDRIVADGELIWLYLPSTAKGQVLKMPRAAGGGLDLASSILRDPRRRYIVVARPDTTIDGRAVRAIQLTPRTPDAVFTRATLWIDPANALIRAAEFTEPSGLRRALTFTRVRTGVSLPAASFLFTPPPGVRVIDQAALLGGSAPEKRP